MPGKDWILIADDNDDDAFLIARALKEAGLDLHIEFLREGSDVIPCLRGEGSGGTWDSLPKFIVLDHMMPGLSGLEVLQQIRREPTFRLLPVILHSGAMNPGDIREAYELGANAYVEKPVDFQKLKVVFKELGIFWGKINIPAMPVAAH